MSLSTSPILAAAASNDLQGVRWLVEREAIPLDMIGDWCVKTPLPPKKNGAFFILFFLGASFDSCLLFA